ncbi:MAG: AraC family transcriptional regulator [Lentisphaerae bacterium]|nr:MAG: AraC family transcriptional regulator [Lentisphaerota bacterium]
MAKLWIRKIITPREFSSLPSIRKVAMERHNDPSYQRGPLPAVEKHKQTKDDDWCFGTVQLTLEGRGSLTWRGEAYPLTAGTGFLHHTRGEDLHWQFPPDSRTAWRFLYIQIYGESFQFFVSELMAKFGPIFRFQMEDPALLAWLKLESAPYHLLQLPTTRQVELITNLQVMILRGYQIDGPQLHPLVTRALEIIESKYNEPCSVHDLARELKVSREHLSRCFRNHMNITVRDYLLNKRLETACDLLRDPRLAIGDIAQRCGFSGSTPFSRVFKEHFGVPPSRYRQLGSGGLRRRDW